MTTDHRAILKNIRTFPSLVRYLRDEMGWPIETDDFEEISFEYTPEELGINEKNAAKIDEIKRLRPLAANQPWGIFFVKFEPKRLPVVALRRILSKVVMKKRATAERAVWAADDLLFVSNYGEGDERKITFAHFSQPGAREELPILKVLGWDDADTALHLDGVAEVLTSKLRWPSDEKNPGAWREQWRSAFTIRYGEIIRTSKDLSIRLASLAKAIRKRILKALAIETETGPLTKLMKAFQAALVQDLDADGFADMYAQTIAYGLLSARIADPHSKTADDFAAQMRTNPFLKELMQTFLKVGGPSRKAGGPGIDFDELGVSEVVELLDDPNTHMEAVVRDFGDRNPQEDPVIHFYELFLKEYDAKKRMQRGVFYTPRPVVSYIVRSVDELLRTEFGLENGLADITTWREMLKKHSGLSLPVLKPRDPEKQDSKDELLSPDTAFVQILDPATGTGTFLVEVIDLVHKTLVAKWKAQGHGEKKIEALWNEYVPLHLLPRLHGYELLMAPYAIAHLKIGLKLYETGYRFGTDERARIFLTNALEPEHNIAQLKLAGILPALAHEAQAVNEIKLKQRFTVIIGNPPYSGHSSNFGEWITRLVDDYYVVDGQPLGEKNPKWLQDDYVKFFRLGEYCIAQTGCGIHSYITNHGYIDNPTFRGLRQHLILSFDAIDILDLHGNATKKERSPDGSDDQNVFEIKQGVAIIAARRRPALPRFEAFITHSDLFGRRELKYSKLLGSTFASRSLRAAQPASPFYLFVPQDLDLRAEYGGYLPITQVMPVNVLGFQTHRDHFAIDFDHATLMKRITEFREKSMTDAKAAEVFDLTDNRDWNVRDARRQLRNDESWRSALIPCTYRPFDCRACYFSTVAMDYPRREMLDHVANKENLCLGLGRQGIAVQDPVWSLVAISKYPVDANIFRRGGINVFPLWLYRGEGTLTPEKCRQANFSPEFARRLANALVAMETADGGLPAGLVPEQVVHYAFGVFHSLSYRTRYAEFLKIDFPRFPLPGNLDLFRDLARLGGRLVALHLMESSQLDHFITTYIGPKNPEVGRVGWSDDTVWLDAAATKKGQPTTPGTIGFHGVPEAVWNFYIGGYQVCEKWLKDRKGRTLTKDDIAHYQKIVVALNETIHLMKEIDEIIEAYGGWPGAFIKTEAPQYTSYYEAQMVAEPKKKYGGRKS